MAQILKHHSLEVPRMLEKKSMSHNLSNGMLPMSIKLVNFMMTHRLAMDNWDVQQTSYINKYFFVIRRGCTVDIIVVELVKYPF